MATKEEYLQRLDDAEKALHELQTGTKEVEVSYDGRTVRYNAMNIGSLTAYIAFLKVKSGDSTAKRKPIFVSF